MEYYDKLNVDCVVSDEDMVHYFWIAPRTCTMDNQCNYTSTYKIYHICIILLIIAYNPPAYNFMYSYATALGVTVNPNPDYAKKICIRFHSNYITYNLLHYKSYRSPIIDGTIGEKIFNEQAGIYWYKISRDVISIILGLL